MVSKPIVTQGQTYTDLTQLQTLKAESHKRDPKALEVAVRQFESLFVSMMLKSMRDANEVFARDNFLNSNQTRFYEGMFDSQLAVTLSEGRGLGLTQVLMRQLSGLVGKNAKELTPEAAEKADAGAATVSRTLDASLSRRARESLAEVERLTSELESAGMELDASLGAATDERVTENRRDSDPIRFDSPEEFVAHLYPIARKVGEELGVDPKVLLAQSALETGWGKHVMPKGGGSSYNLFGIKADHRWSGAVTEVSTLEYRDGVPMREKANFRAYDSYEQSFRDYLNFLRSNPRYGEALEQASDSEDFVHALQRAGYATDPRYGEKITRILRGDRLRDALNQVGA